MSTKNEIIFSRNFFFFDHLQSTQISFLALVYLHYSTEGGYVYHSVYFQRLTPHILRVREYWARSSFVFVEEKCICASMSSCVGRRIQKKKGDDDSVNSIIRISLLVLRLRGLRTNDQQIDSKNKRKGRFGMSPTQYYSLCLLFSTSYLRREDNR